ncbi:alpha/beta fold hydrolase [Sphingomonas sp. LY29]|uniref:alpha/beta fold hydrolase n=1 Tax=Sphingomonas sp. LY29 TaxID=3095341 RepID=UPI002D778C47|nr:alpha/beta fold hydrolase [Sphingomonas sp. LY29]WRP26471.1 alpha/beta fold hydrolase [Sphingomonas sp. LY29]
MRVVTSLIMAATLAVPSAAHAQRAGQLISATPVQSTPAGMQAWRISYSTSTGKGQPRQVTGMVVAPREAIPRNPRNVLAWTHGTWGVASRCAPSLSANFWNVTPALDAVRQGYVVVAPDYPGLGSNGVHPFLVGVDSARSTIDAVRASRSIQGAAAGRRYAVWGESQGGHAALWTAQVARNYANDVTLVGAAAAAPPTDLIQNLRQSLNRNVRTLFTAFIGHSWANHYGASLATLGGPQTRGLITRLAENNCISLETKPRLSTIAGILVLQRNLRNVDLGTRQPWSQLARANSPTRANFGVPLWIGQNPADDLVAPAVTRSHARALCQSGARLTFASINGAGGHATSAKDSAAQTLAWIGDRFAGRPAPRNCSGA